MGGERLRAQRDLGGESVVCAQEISKRVGICWPKAVPDLPQAVFL